MKSKKTLTSRIEDKILPPVYEVRYSTEVVNRLDRLDAKTRRRIIGKIEAVAADPAGRHPNVDHLTGMAALRLRVGQWRVIFALDHSSGMLRVEHVRARGEAYKRR